MNTQVRKAELLVILYRNFIKNQQFTPFPLPLPPPALPIFSLPTGLLWTITSSSNTLTSSASCVYMRMWWPSWWIHLAAVHRPLGRLRRQKAKWHRPRRRCGLRPYHIHPFVALFPYLSHLYLSTVHFSSLRAIHLVSPYVHLSCFYIAPASQFVSCLFCASFVIFIIIPHPFTVSHSVLLCIYLFRCTNIIPCSQLFSLPSNSLSVSFMMIIFYNFLVKFLWVVFLWFCRKTWLVDVWVFLCTSFWK